MGIRNKYIYSLDSEYLATLREEYEMLGFHTSRPEAGVLVIHTRRPKKKREKEKHQRDKRSEKFERR